MAYYQPVEINVLSAEDLNSINPLFKPTVYVSVSVTRGSRDIQVTPAAIYCKKVLQWNYSMKFYLEDDKVQNNESIFVFEIKVKRFYGSDVVGKLFVPVKQLIHLNEEKTIDEHTIVNYQVITETGKPKGCICLGFRFGCVFKGKIRGYDSDNVNVRVHEDCGLGVWGSIKHEPSAPCDDDIIYA